MVEEGPHEILVLHSGGVTYAVSNICTHEEIWLDEGTIHESTCEIECPMHEGRFDLRTGAATHEPAECAIRTFEVVIEGDDVFVAVPDADA